MAEYPRMHKHATARERLISLLAAVVPTTAHTHCRCGNGKSFTTPDELADSILSQHVQETGIRLFNAAGEPILYGFPIDLGTTPPAAYTCPRCHRTSYHPEDIANGYCGLCHDYTGGAPSWPYPKCFRCLRPLVDDHDRAHGYCPPCYALYIMSPEDERSEQRAAAGGVDVDDGGDGDEDA